VAGIGSLILAGMRLKRRRKSDNIIAISKAGEIDFFYRTKKNQKEKKKKKKTYRKKKKKKRKKSNRFDFGELE
jgi:hypothetical protein